LKVATPPDAPPPPGPAAMSLDGLDRRDWLRAGGAWLAATAAGALVGCDAGRGPGARTGFSAVPGGWTGLDVERGHRLRASAGPPFAHALAPARRADVLVIGGGIAGLAAARALVEAGIEDFALLDLADETGGHSRGHRLGGLACPLGAHYLPVPGEDQPDLVAWLEELGLTRIEQGRRVWDERHLAHSPQERLFIDGAWHEGLLPPAEALGERDGAVFRRQWASFTRAVDGTVRGARARGGAHPFALPAAAAPWTPGLAALDTETFATWLDRQGLDQPALRWLLDYVCRDDYGAPASRVSAWAGVHYFASRHANGDAGLADPQHAADPVLTWPEGNAWLAERLARPLGARAFTGRVATAVRTGRGRSTDVAVWDARLDRVEHWQASQVVIATPVFIARRLLERGGAALEPGLATALAAAGQRLAHAPWVVANLHLERPLADRVGAPPAWDNVVYGDSGLGYVDATHQSTASVPGPTVLTLYRALGDDPAAERRERQALIEQPWTQWLERLVTPLEAAHPDLRRKVTAAALTRWGHAMAIPEPGVRTDVARGALAALAAARGPLHFAHADLSGYSVFEEAFAHGLRAGRAAAAALRAA
jgi:predicted NAD/FAD-dependent oxidoreductase